MSRIHRADNIGMHITPAPSRFYGVCPTCGRDKPMHWISKKEYRCYDCLKGRQVEKIEPKPENTYSGRKRFPQDRATDEITQRQLKRIRASAERERQRIIRKKQNDNNQ